MRRFLLSIALLTASCSIEAPPGLAEIISGLRDAGQPDAQPDVPPVETDWHAPERDVAGGTDTSSCSEGAPCDDGNPCTTGDVCFGGMCLGGFLVDCDDADPCTADACDPSLGCVHAALDTQECLPPVPCDGDCEDGDPCTIDGCDSQTGNCRHDLLPDCFACDPEAEPSSAQCDDGEPANDDLCQWREALGGWICVHVPWPCGIDPASCDDDDSCTNDSLGADCLCHYEDICPPD